MDVIKAAQAYVALCDEVRVERALLVRHEHPYEGAWWNSDREPSGIWGRFFDDAECEVCVANSIVQKRLQSALRRRRTALRKLAAAVHGAP